MFQYYEFALVEHLSYTRVRVCYKIHFLRRAPIVSGVNIHYWHFLKRTDFDVEKKSMGHSDNLKI